MDLAIALTQFDRTMANLELLQGLWKQYEEHIPTSPAFGLDTPEMDQIRREFADIAASLPAIDGDHLDIELSPLDEISQMIWDYMEIGEPLDGYRASQQEAYAPKRRLDDYQHEAIKRRRILVRNRVEHVVATIDELLRSTFETSGGRTFPDGVDGWVRLREWTGELDRLRGPEVLAGTRIRDLRRHLRFAEPCDLDDIVREDWPSVRSALVDLIFDGEPLPVEVADLGDLVRSESTGSVTSRAPEPAGGAIELLRMGESQTVEFKSTARWNLHADRVDKKMEHVITKTVCGFLNAHGGKLLIGVDDDGNVIGLDPDLQTLGRKGNKDGYELFLRQRLDDSLSVPTAGIVGISFESIEGKDLCVVSASSSSKPVFAKPHEGGSGYSEFWVRVGNATKQFHGNNMLDYQANHWG